MLEQVKLNSSGRKAIIAPFVWIIIQMIVFFLSAGTFSVLRGWIYFLSTIVITSSNALFMWIVIPELANERGSFKSDSKPIDKIFISLFIVIPVIVTPIVAGIEIGRLNSVFFGSFVMLIAIGFYIIANALNLWSMSVNRHFEGTVRIQNDRDHKVISSGPYGVVRHPGYSAMIIGTLVVPLIIGSVFALIPAVIEVVVIVARTHYEDKTLKEELEGYLAYTSEVRFRLIPGIW